MRIIPDDAIWSFNDYIKKWDTVEITDEDLEEIYVRYWCYENEESKSLGGLEKIKSFPQYFKELIELAITK